MHIGCQFTAPEGCGSLVSSTDYYLLCNRPDLDAMTFAWFSRQKHEWRVNLIRLTRDNVEAALRDGRLVMSITQSSVPPWLRSIEGVSIDELEAGRRESAKSYREYAQSRLATITPFLNQEFEHAFDGAARPEKLFKKTLAALWEPQSDDTPSVTMAEPPESNQPHNPPNALRTFLWYCTFRLFGRQIESLIPAYSGIGNWSRDKWIGDAKRLGRPNKSSGSLHGHSAVAIADRIQDAYVRNVDLGRTMVAIHEKALREEFGCKVQTLTNGSKSWFHPEDLAFPTYQQFRYWVLKKFSLEDVQRNRWGEARFRSRMAATAGSFSQDSANYLETAEADVYYIPELPRQVLSRDPAPALLVCRLADMATGNIFGVGFSSGGETAEAYALANFCAVVPRTLMGRIFGIPLTDDDWIGRGLPSRGIYDRGAGSSSKADGVGQAASPIKELAPSWSGQSKATVESSHPRHTNLEGEPTYVISNLNVFQMAVRELLRTPAENHRKDAVGRLTPQMLLDGVPGNPAAITKYLVDRLRTSAIPMATDVAVRKYLRPVEFIQKKDGLWLGDLHFSHSHLHEHGLPTRVPTDQQLTIKGFVYPYSLYLAWVEIKGRLYEVEPFLRIRDDREQLQITLADLRNLGEMRRAAAALQREHGAAAMSEFQSQFFDQFGIEADSSSRVKGKKPRPKEIENVPMATAKRTAA